MVVSDEITWNRYLADMVWLALPGSSAKTRTTTQFNFRCPICGDSKKSTTKKRGFYYINTASYHCFNCEANLSGLSLLKAIASEPVYHEALTKYRNLKLKNPTGNFVEGEEKDCSLVPCQPIPAWKILCDKHGWPLPTPLTKDAVEYLKGRKITQFENFLSVKNQAGVPFILILYLYQGDCIFYQLHNYTKAELRPGQSIKYLFPLSVELNDQEKPVFGLDAVDPSWPFIIGCEGVYDALSYVNGVAFGGRTVKEYQLRMLKARWPHHTLVMALDNDEPGQKATLKLCSNAGICGKFLNIGPLFDKVGVKDANDFIQLSPRCEVMLKDKKVLENMMRSPLETRIELLFENS